MTDFTYRNPQISHEKLIDRRKITKMHYHEEHELYHLMNGTLTYYVEDEIFYLKPGDFIFIPKGIEHKTDSEDCMYNERMLLSIDESVFDESTHHILNELSEIKIIHIPKNSLYEIDDLMHKLEQEYFKSNIHKNTMIKLYILEILVKLCRLNKKEETVINDANEMMTVIAEYINQNFNQNISLKSLSEKFALSDSHLSRKFKKVIGVGVNEYITNIRIKNAEKLLMQKEYSITEISEKCGFNDSNYFSTVFKNSKGVTPFKYSQNIKK